MKCEYCAGDLSIEDVRCPHCDAENPFYEAHRKDMQRFEKKYNDTERKVMEKVDKSTKRSFYVAVIMVLIFLNIICSALYANVDEGRFKRKNEENKKRQDEYIAEAENLLSEGKYIEFYSLMNDKYVYFYENPMRKYSDVQQVAGYYKTIHLTLADIIEGQNNYQGNEEYAKKISNALEYMYDERYKDVKYLDDLTHSDEMLSYMDDMINETHLLFRIYLGMDEATIKELKDLSPAKRQVIIEEKVMEVMSDEEE